MMKITFLGSSHGVPEPNRKCSCVLLEVGNNRYLIDVGSDPTEELIRRGMSLDSINAVFITHMHGDHINGLLPFVDLCSWFYKTAKPEIWVPDLEIVPALRLFLKTGGIKLSALIRFHQVNEGPIFDDGTITVTAIRTGHTKCSFGFIIRADQRSVVFTGDMKGDTGPVEDYPKMVKEDGLDLVVAECAHFDAMLYQTPLEKHPPKLFCFNHYSWSHIESCYHLKDVMKERQAIIMATDGLEIQV